MQAIQSAWDWKGSRKTYTRLQYYTTILNNTICTCVCSYISLPNTIVSPFQTVYNIYEVLPASYNSVTSSREPADKYKYLLRQWRISISIFSQQKVMLNGNVQIMPDKSALNPITGVPNLGVSTPMGSFAYSLGSWRWKLNTNDE